MHTEYMNAASGEGKRDSECSGGSVGGLATKKLGYKTFSRVPDKNRLSQFEKSGRTSKEFEVVLV